MQRTLIAPNRARLLRPVHAGDAVVVARDEPHHVVPDHRVLVVVDVVDAGDVDADAGEQRLPTCDWVRSDHGMDGSELEVFVQRRASGRHDLVAAGLAGGFEDWLRAGGGEGLHVGAEGGGHAVVAAGTGQFDHFIEGEYGLTARSQNTRAYPRLMEACPAYAGS